MVRLNSILLIYIDHVTSSNHMTSSLIPRRVAGFDYKTCGVMIAVGQQSQEIGQSVTNATDDDAEQGAGDQVIS